MLLAATAVQASPWPVTAGQKATAEQVAHAGIPLSELADNAPDVYTIKRGDTLWAISKLYLRSPWRWPELWGMNLQQIRNPNLIYPGQVLVLEKLDGMARLKLGNSVGGPSGTVKLSPSIRSEASDTGALAAIPMNLIAPFLNDAIVFDSNELATAPRIVASQESHVVLGRGDLAYVKGDVSTGRDWQVFRDPKPLVDPDTHEILGYEARYVGSAEHLRDGESRPGAQSGLDVPATFRMVSTREEAGVGDRLMPARLRDFTPYIPHPPTTEIQGAIVSLYGDALSAGSNQIVAINRGSADGIERGNVLALWRLGDVTHDESVEHGPLMKLPDERTGLMMVFRVFDRVSYALIMEASEPASPGDRFTSP
ncbi:MAG TPA: LysM peptidoglycan-binding domain-containing protein [Burkholderiaceae bacterium]|jgi:LysM repeat protein|nr:LysM peptidoglycan-binding domain-containing protein [Burkholderiaceae bacterium]